MLKKKLGEILLEQNAIDEYQLRSALGFQKKWGGRLGKVLVDNHFITEETLLSALQKQTGFAAVNLKTLQVPEYVLKLVPKDLAERNHLLPIRLEGDPGKAETLVVAMSDPTNLEALDEIQFKTGKKVKPVLAGEIALAGAIRRLYFGEADGLEMDLPARNGPLDEEMVIVQGTLEQAAMAEEFTGARPAAPSEPPPAAPPPPASQEDPFALLDALDGPAAADPVAPPPDAVPPPSGDPAFATMEEIEDIFSNVEAPVAPPSGPPPVSGSAPIEAPPEAVLDAVDIELDEEISPLEEPPPMKPAAPPAPSPAPSSAGPAHAATAPVPHRPREAGTPPAAAPAPPAPVRPAQAKASPATQAPAVPVAQPGAAPRPSSSQVAPAAPAAPAASKGMGDLLSRVGLATPGGTKAEKKADAPKPAVAVEAVSEPEIRLEELLSGAPDALKKVGGASRVVSILLRLLLKKRLVSEKEVLDALKPKA